MLLVMDNLLPYDVFMFGHRLARGKAGTCASGHCRRTKGKEAGSWEVEGLPVPDMAADALGLGIPLATCDIWCSQET